MIEMPKTKGEAVPRGNVRIPKPVLDRIDEIVRESELYVSRQQFIESAIREKIERNKLGNEREAINPVSEEGTAAPSKEMHDELSAKVRNTFLAHAIMNAVKEKSLPADHLDPKDLEQNIRQYIAKTAEREGKKITGKYMDELTEEILEFHREILEGLSL